MIKATSEAVYHFTAKMQKDHPQALIPINLKSSFRHAVMPRVWVKDIAIAKFGSEEALEADIKKWDDRKIERYKNTLAEYHKQYPEASPNASTKAKGKLQKKGVNTKKEAIPPPPRVPKLSKDHPVTLEPSAKKNSCVTVT